MLLIFLALVSPLDELADTYLFSVHMAKHILFVLVVPALLLIGLPAAPVETRCSDIALRPLPKNFWAHPAVAWTAGIGAMAFWHIPVLFNAALSNEALHICRAPLASDWWNHLLVADPFAAARAAT